MRYPIQLLVFVSVGLAPMTAACMCPFQWTPFGTSCYRLVVEGLSYDSAEQNCRQLSTYRKEAHLVSINSPEELEFIREYVSRVFPDGWKEIWIGLRLGSGAQTPRWEDGSDPAAFSFWSGSTTAPVPVTQAGYCTLYTVSQTTWKNWGNCGATVPSVCKMDQD